jgi:hypothetical protein
MDLRSNSASDARIRDLPSEFIARMERAGRVVTPLFADWQLATGQRARSVEHAAPLTLGCVRIH